MVRSFQVIEKEAGTAIVVSSHLLLIKFER